MPSSGTVRAGLALGVTLMAFAVGACNTQTSTDPSHGITVVASTDVWGSVASAVAGEHATVQSILNSAVADPHSYEATPTNATAIADASLVVYNGGGYDHWVDDVLTAHPGGTVVDAYSLMPSQPAGEPANEHVFYDLGTAKAVAAAIAARLAEKDPSNAAAYGDNAAVFGRETDVIAATEREIGRKHPGLAVVATEPVAHYLLANAGIADRTPASFASAVEAGGDPAPVDVAAMLDLIDGREVSAVVVNTQTETAVTNQIQDAARKAGLPIVSITETLPDGMDYLGWQRQTVEELDNQLGHAPTAAR